MNNTIVFNTLHHYEKMIEVGFTEKQAKAQTDYIAQLVDDKLATKKDLKDVELALKQDLLALESRITTKLVAITVIIPTILKILEHFKI